MRDPSAITRISLSCCPCAVFFAPPIYVCVWKALVPFVCVVTHGRRYWCIWSTIGTGCFVWNKLNANALAMQWCPRTFVCVNMWHGRPNYIYQNVVISIRPKSGRIVWDRNAAIFTKPNPLHCATIKRFLSVRVYGVMEFWGMEA